MFGFKEDQPRVSWGKKDRRFFIFYIVQEIFLG
jgi:hypothetical protein